MREQAIEKLNDWFGDLEYSFEILQDGDDTCIVLTISNSFNDNEKDIGLYRIFKIGDSVEISQDIEYTCDTSHDSSLVAGIADVMKVYRRI